MAKRSVTELFERYTGGAQATAARLQAAIAEDQPRRRDVLLAYLDGESPQTISSRLGYGSRTGAVFSLVQYGMRAAYRRIYGSALPTLHADRPSRLARPKTGYRTDSEAHKAARRKVSRRRRKQIAAAGGAAFAARAKRKEK